MNRVSRARLFLLKHKSRSRTLAWFLVVGCLAALVHWTVVVVLVERFRWHPLLANCVGWLTAFTVSFTGHHQATFRGHGTPLLKSASRFFVISASGFVINEVIYALLLRWMAQRYDLILGIVLLAVAVMTYFMSRHWAFLNIAAQPRARDDRGPASRV